MRSGTVSANHFSPGRHGIITLLACLCILANCLMPRWAGGPVDASRLHGVLAGQTVLMDFFICSTLPYRIVNALFTEGDAPSAGRTGGRGTGAPERRHVPADESFIGPGSVQTVRCGDLRYTAESAPSETGGLSDRPGLRGAVPPVRGGFPVLLSLLFLAATLRLPRSGMINMMTGNMNKTRPCLDGPFAAPRLFIV